MDALTLKVNLDCLRKDSQAIINAKVGEANGRKVVFTLYEGRTTFFVPAGASVIFRAQKPDGTILYNNCVIDDGKVEYTITSQTVAVAGVYACELQIVSDGRIIYSPYVTLNVMDNLYADTEVESSNEFTELENALNRIPSLEVINSKYTKPEGGIPKSDLAQDVQNSLSKADTALQEHQSLAAYRTAAEQDIIDSTKQDKLIAGDNITIAADGKTISATGGGGSTVELDTTLSATGKAADAKAVGDALAGKQNTISDLETIRSGAAKGATALQSVPSTYRTALAQDVIDSDLSDRIEVIEGKATGWDGKYVKPTSGIPKTDLANDVQASLGKADTALQSVPSTYRTASAQDTIDSGKVDKVTGKGLSSNDYTDAAKAKVDALAPVATSGSYNDLTSKPTIPTTLPNPNALTFTGAVTGSYDGSAAMTVNIPSAVTDAHINSLIDTKLGVIENGAY